MSLHLAPMASTTCRIAQRGVSLIFALVTMVALSLAAVALIRSVDSGTLALGNLGFKQDTLLAADDASRTALRWLSDNITSSTLHQDITASAYYATTRDTTANPLDVTGNRSGNTRTVIDWGNGCGGLANCLNSKTVAAMDNGVTARYVILRLCDATGDPTASGSTIQCARPLATAVANGSERGSLSYANAARIGNTTISQYFRILVRAEGGRRTVTYTETLVHF